MKSYFTTAALMLFAIQVFSQIPFYVPTNGLRAWYPFNGNANDMSGNNIDGVVTNALLSADRYGVPNSSYYFNGTNAYITLPIEGLNLSGTNEFTISLWFRNIFDDNVQTLFSHWNHNVTQSGVSLGYLLRSDDFKIYTAFLSYQQLQTAVAFSDSTWTHLVIVYNGTLAAQADRQKIYVNGVDFGEVNLGISSIPASLGINANYTHIGARFGTGGSIYEHYWGDIDDLGIWNRALSFSEVQGIYTGCGSLVATQPLNQLGLVSSNVQFECSGSNPSSNYQWQSNPGSGFVNLTNAGQYSGVNDSILVVSNIQQTNHLQTFRCVVTNGNCYDTTISVILEIDCGIMIDIQPLGVSVFNGGTAQFHAQSNIAGANYQWQADIGFGFQNINNAGQYGGVNTPFLTVSNVTIANDNQIFRCIISSGICADTSATAALTYNTISLEESQALEIKAYPNPVRDFLVVELSEFTSPKNYLILDIRGSAVLMGVLHSPNQRIDVTQLSTGTFYLVVDSTTLQFVVAE
jgi:hypothetical protein